MMITMMTIMMTPAQALPVERQNAPLPTECHNTVCPQQSCSTYERSQRVLVRGHAGISVNRNASVNHVRRAHRPLDTGGSKGTKIVWEIGTHPTDHHDRLGRDNHRRVPAVVDDQRWELTKSGGHGRMCSKNRARPRAALAAEPVVLRVLPTTGAQFNWRGSSGRCNFTLHPASHFSRTTVAHTEQPGILGRLLSKWRRSARDSMRLFDLMDVFLTFDLMPCIFFRPP
jgi:hypothetical protein